MTTIDYLNHIKEKLNCVDNITFRKMMGEYLLYYKGVLAGGIYDNRFLIKKTDLSRKILDGFDEVLPYEGSKTYMYEVNVDEFIFTQDFFEKIIK